MSLKAIKEKIKNFTWVRNRRYRKYDQVVKPLIAREIDKVVESEPFPMFRFLEVETLNRCNGGCSFCPVNKNSDPREYKRMSEELFTSILQQLKDLEFTGNLHLYSNNEPLIDKRIYDFTRQARETLPKAKIVLLTNGVLLDVEKMKRLEPYLDYFQIDNYSDEDKMHDNVKEVKAYMDSHDHEGLEFVIRMRKETEVLTTRGGNAPNAVSFPKLESSCVVPFQQMVIRPDGKVSLCSNDALGSMTFGDVSTTNIYEVWKSEAFQAIREKIRQGREHVKLCEACDSFYGDVPYPNWKAN